MRKLKFLGAMAAGLALFGAGCSFTPPGEKSVTEGSYVPKTADTSPIKIGWVGPLTGDAASVGKDALTAAQLAVEEVNAAGGINGRMLELVAEDGKCNPKDAATAGNKLINVDKVPAIVGTACSGEMMAIAPTAEQNKTIMVGYCASAPTVSAAGDYIFRTYPSDVLQSKFVAEYVYNTLGKKKVATLAVLGDWGTGLKNGFEQRFKELGGEVVSSQDYVQESRDLRTQLTKAKDSQPEILFFVGYTEASIAGLKQAKELGLNVSIIGGDAWDDTKIHANSFAEGIMYSVGAAPQYDLAWVEKLKQKGATTNVCVPRSYDNVKLLAEIMKRTGTDTAKIKDELYKVQGYQGIGGIVNMDSNGDNTSAQFQIKVVKNGKAEAAK
ncbi:MAG: ABC transporter substrate-binding protein [Candidatus Magasanikbacteria bacterium]|nr:ABC transporter substrate-binding protein [Candidatus Magasanikbacteria bacterium]